MASAIWRSSARISTLGLGTAVAADDVMDAYQGAFIVDRGDRGRHASIQGFGQDGVDLFAQAAIDVVARREQQRRDETVETVEAQEQLDLGPPAQAQDAHRGFEQFVLGNLEQLVAGKVSRIWASALPSWLAGARPARAITAAHLVRKQRHFAGGKAIGAGGEEADKAALAIEDGHGRRKS